MNTLYLYSPAGRLIALPFGSVEDARAWLNLLDSRGRGFPRAVYFPAGRPPVTLRNA